MQATRANDNGSRVGSECWGGVCVWPWVVPKDALLLVAH